jgi:GAF domain-containing protein
MSDSRSESTESPVLDAIARTAAELTDATGSAVLALRGSARVVVAVGGSDPPWAVGERPAADDSLSYVAAGGQSLSLAEAHGASLCVPCIGGDGVVGALELRRDGASEPFSVESAHVAGLLADALAAALEQDRDVHAGAPTPGELAGELAQLASTDRVRYDAIARAVAALLGGG